MGSVKTVLRPVARRIRHVLARIQGRDTTPHAAKVAAIKAAKIAPTKPAASISYIPFGKTTVEIAIDPATVSAELRGIIQRGKYEGSESRTAVKVLEADEIVLELGAGVGLISTIVMQSGRAKAVHCFEADARLIPLIHATHKRNGVKGAHVYHAAITGDPAALKRGLVEFHIRDNFWSNSTNTVGRSDVHTVVQVKTLRLADLVQVLRPTVIIADIEGAERGLFDGADLTSVKHILLEVHPHIIGPQGVRDVFNALHAKGFYYDPPISMKSVPGFSRG